TSVSAFCWARMTPAFFSARSTSGTTASSGSCSADGAEALRLRTLAASTWALSFTSGNEAVLPTIACDTDLARRCDCIIAWPVAPTRVEPPRADGALADHRQRAAERRRAGVGALHAGLAEIGDLRRHRLGDDRAAGG